MTRVRSLVRSVGAVLGTACLLLALGGAVFGIKALVFRSGSMGPEIPAGSIGLARAVEADEIAVGDVVSVVNAKSVRVTHRVVRIDGTGRVRTLTLQGDANPSPDAEGYRVTEVDRVLWSVPVAGFAVTWLGSPPGLILLGGAALGILVLGFAGRDETRQRGRRRAAMAAIAPVVGGAMVIHAFAGTAAAFSDSAAVSGAAIASGSVLNPGTAASNCTANNSLLGSTITFRWNGISPMGAPRPQLANHTYELRFFNRNGGASLGTVTQAHSGGAGTVQTYSSGASTLATLLGLNLLSLTEVRLEIYARLGSTNWYSLTPVVTNWRVTTLLGIVTFTCNA